MISRHRTTALVLRSNGEIGRVDATTRTFETVVDVGLGASGGAVMDPAMGDQAAIASPSGIALVSLADAGPIASSIPRHPAARNTTIAPDGRYAVTGGAGDVAPTTVWSRNGTTWNRDETVPEGPDAVAGVGPTYDDPFLALIGPGNRPPQRFYSLADDSPEFVGELEWVDPFYSAGSGHAERQLIVQGGPIGIQVYDSSTGDPGVRLPAPPGSEGEDISSVRFDPSGQRLLISAASGRSQLWNTSDWEPIDLPQLESADIAVAYWNEDGSIVATASSTGTASIRHGETFELIRNMVGAIGTGNTWNNGALLLSADNRLAVDQFRRTRPAMGRNHRTTNRHRIPNT